MHPVGLRGDHPVPPCAGNYAGLEAIVCGSGRGLWDDLARLQLGRRDVVAVNFGGSHLPVIVTHWCSLHHDQLKHWVGLRSLMYPDNAGIITHSITRAEGVDHVWAPENGGGGCSGLFAAMVGLWLGYSRVILCGVPEDGNGHFYDPPRSAGTYSNIGAESAWRYAADRIFQGRVKSLSGLTRTILGEP